MEPIRAAIAKHWRSLYNFAVRVTLDRDSATAVVEETFLRAYVGAEKMPEGDEAVERWLFKIASHVAEKTVSALPEVSFDKLDEVLRSEATRTDVVSSLTDPQRNFMLWELKQGCMTAVVNCLPPGERVAFVLSVILGQSEEEGARTLGITSSAYKVRLSRARKKVADYLAPRCEHVNPANPCRCPSRLGVAIHQGFLRAPGAEVSLRPSFGRYGVDGEDAPLRDVMAIYHSLPEPEAPSELEDRLLAKLDSGEWEQVRNEARAAKAKSPH